MTGVVVGRRVQIEVTSATARPKRGGVAKITPFHFSIHSLAQWPQEHTPFTPSPIDSGICHYTMGDRAAEIAALLKESSSTTNAFRMRQIGTNDFQTAQPSVYCPL